mmetsp:Transcript_7578/g.12336  ORF Transcript_7578/g.12336 Transcript_7578/m.12336 type:complete len:120 (+) Transcript_7578:1757-2116(+)
MAMRVKGTLPRRLNTACSASVSVFLFESEAASAKPEPAPAPAPEPFTPSWAKDPEPSPAPAPAPVTAAAEGGSAVSSFATIFQEGDEIEFKVADLVKTGNKLSIKLEGPITFTAEGEIA